ncbi:MAG: hypothetical protein NZL83_01545 [Candidatus Absconditabacterales bacterium]|nr:hypothetical protein [Candidatus Absconditabacterales bacterium]
MIIITSQASRLISTIIRAESGKERQFYESHTISLCGHKHQGFMTIMRTMVRPCPIPNLGSKIGKQFHMPRTIKDGPWGRTIQTRYSSILIFETIANDLDHQTY